MSPFDRDIWQEIFATMRKNKLRTGLTGFSVAWGIFMLVVLLGVGEGLQKGVAKAFFDDATETIFISPSSTALAYKGQQPNRKIDFRNTDFEHVKSEFAPEKISARYGTWNAPVSYKNQYGAYSIRGIHPAYIEIEKNWVISGRHLHHKDLQEAAKVVVIGRLLAEDIFKTEDPVGKYLVVKDVPFKVVGTFGDEGGEREERIIYMPITTAQKLYALGGIIGDLALIPPTGMTLEQSKVYGEKLKADFARRLNFDPQDPRAVFVRNTREQAEMVQGILSGIKIFIWVIGLGTIVAGVIGVANIMMIVVKDRTKEIGIRKAIGATPASIILQIILEAIFITSFFGYFGLMGGVVLLESLGPNLQGDYFKDPEINFQVALTTLGILIVSGAVAGYIPARKAAAINPIEALKDT